MPTITDSAQIISRWSSRDGPTSASAYDGPMAEPHKDYSGNAAAEEARHPGGRAVYVAGAPQGFDTALGTLPTGVQRLRRRRPSMDVALVFVTEERDLRSRFVALAAASTPPGDSGSRGRRRQPRSRPTSASTPSSDRTRRRARRQQERLDHRDLPGAAVRLPPQGPAAKADRRRAEYAATRPTAWTHRSSGV